MKIKPFFHWECSRYVCNHFFLLKIVADKSNKYRIAQPLAEVGVRLELWRLFVCFGVVLG